MNKLFALYRNEMTKVWRRPVLYIMALIMLALIVGVSFLLREVSQFAAFEPISELEIEADIAGNREHYTSVLQSTDQMLKAAESAGRENRPSTLSQYQQYGQAKAELDRVDWIESHKELYRDLGRMGSGLLRPYTELKARQHTYERKPASVRTIEETTAYLMLKATLPTFEARFESGTLIDLIEMMNEFRNLVPNGTDENKEINDKVAAYELELARSGASATKLFALSTGYRNALEEKAGAVTSVGSKQHVYLPSELTDLDNNILIYEYRATAPGGDPIESATANIYYYVLVSFAAFIIGILVIIVAGSQISSERSSGSIKSLILSPVKRWKIVTAKLLVCITVLLAFIVLSWLICILSMRLILGQSLQPYLFVRHGEVHAFGGWLYGLVTSALQNIGSLFFMLFAFMLSSVGLSTAASVGISMGIRFGAQPLVFLLTRLLPNATWMRFLPFEHFDLQHHILPLDFTSGGIDLGRMFGASQMDGGGSPLTFSLVWLGALSLVMLVSSYDTFMRKDL